MTVGIHINFNSLKSMIDITMKLARGDTICIVHN